MNMQTNNWGNKLILFFLFPFISAINALMNIQDGVSHRILYLWFLIFGVGFCAVNEAADSYRYVEAFMVESNYSWSQYLILIKEWWTFDTNIKDIYALTVNVFVGHFSSNYHWTYVIYATVFGFFYIKSIKIFLYYNQVSNNFVFIMLLFMFCFSNPIFNINGARFWTASWIGVYATLGIFVQGDYKKTLLLLLLPLVHGSSSIWILFVIFAFLLQRLQRLSIILYILSSFVSATSYLDILGNYSHLLPKFMQNQIWSYTESEYAIERMSGISPYGKEYAIVLNALPSYFQILMCLLLIYNRRLINADKKATRLLNSLLIFSSFANFLSPIPSLGRFKMLVIPFMVIVWAYNYNILYKYNKFFYLIPLIYAYSLLYWYRNMNSVTEIYLYILPVPITIIKYLFL